MTLKKIDLTGQRFGELTVIEEAERGANGRIRWLCKCSCGADTVKYPKNLRLGRATSCGCTGRNEIFKTTHAQAGTPLYRRWAEMVKRTTNPNGARYADYGGRGITVCPEWRQSFEAFARDMGPTFQPGLTLERIDNERGYAPGNVRWATYREQARNTRRNHRVQFRGQNRILVEWCELLGLSYGAVRQRLYRGWPTERALTTGADPEALARLVGSDEDGQAA
jgi:hypothetical protein